jgi:hypothetical protein
VCDGVWRVARALEVLGGVCIGCCHVIHAPSQAVHKADPASANVPLCKTPRSEIRQRVVVRLAFDTAESIHPHTTSRHRIFTRDIVRLYSQHDRLAIHTLPARPQGTTHPRPPARPARPALGAQERPHIIHPHPGCSGPLQEADRRGREAQRPSYRQAQ